VIGPATIPLAAGESASIVAHLTEGGELTASKFTNNTSRIRPNNARVIVHHTAAAPAVDICVVPRNGQPKLTIEGASNGDQASADVRRGRYYVDIAPAGSDQVVFGPAYVTFERKTITLVYAVGSLTNGTFTLLTKVISG
jgi:hypothetical protein